MNHLFVHKISQLLQKTNTRVNIMLTLGVIRQRLSNLITYLKVSTMMSTTVI